MVPYIEYTPEVRGQRGGGQAGQRRFQGLLGIAPRKWRFPW